MSACLTKFLSSLTTAISSLSTESARVKESTKFSSLLLKCYCTCAYQSKPLRVPMNLQFPRLVVPNQRLAKLRERYGKGAQTGDY